MEKIDNIIDFYNEVSDEKIDVNGIMPIIPMMKLVGKSFMLVLAVHPIKLPQHNMLKH